MHDVLVTFLPGSSWKILRVQLNPAHSPVFMCIKHVLLKAGAQSVYSAVSVSGVQQSESVSMSFYSSVLTSGTLLTLGRLSLPGLARPLRQ